MSEKPNTWTPNDLVQVANLTSAIREFNKGQYGDRKLFATVTLYRFGDDVATIDDHDSDGEVTFGTTGGV